MRAGEVALTEPTEEEMTECYSKKVWRPSLQELRLGYESTHQMRKVAGTEPAIGWTGQVRLNDDHYAR